MKFKFLIFMIFFLPSYSYASISITQFNMEKTDLSQLDIIKFNSTVINTGYTVLSQIKISSVLISKLDGNEIKLESNLYSFLPREAKRLSLNFSLSNVYAGNYTLVYKISKKSGAPITHISKDIIISGKTNNIFFSKILNTENYVYTGDKSSLIKFKSSQNKGVNIIKNSDFKLLFSLKSLKNEVKSQNLSVNYYLGSTYSNKKKLILTKNVYFNNKIENNYSNIFNLNKPGTFKLYVNILNSKGKLILNSNLRIVITGKSGSIINLENKKDIYEMNETFFVTSTIVGSADGFSNISNSKLKLEIISNNSLKFSKILNIKNIGFVPIQKIFKFKLPFKLNTYQIKITFYDNSKIYDILIQNYSKLNGKLFLNDNGQIFSPTLNSCVDNNFCSSLEKDLGNCYDCIMPKFKLKKKLIKTKLNDSKIIIEKNNYNFVYLGLIMFIFLTIIISGIYFLRKNRSDF